MSKHESSGLRYAGTFNRVDTRHLKHFWEVRGHSVQVDKADRGRLFHIYIRLEKTEAAK